ncbi:hypothetical protein PN471_22725 [Aphanizomenon sp. CS-733/32]|nr:hypothetical protein [Aphanizomenon sp. CS-733/32]MDB9311388.1 hypothetical protein [Aphanizomenon sp. CS-733/32]
MSNWRSEFNKKSEEDKELLLRQSPQLLLVGKEYTELFKLLSANSRVY